MPAASPLRNLPKIELHCHLDACVRVGTVGAIGRELGLDLPADLERALVAPEVCRDLMDYISRLDLALEVMQRASDLRRIGRELAQDLAADGVVYAEIRFAPVLHTRRGLALQQVLEAVHAGLREGGQAHGVSIGLILCCLRSRPPAESLELARLAAANRDLVCGFDIAGDEAGFGAAPHAPAFRLAREAGLRVTAHAGESAGPASIREALELLGAERIGHGVRIEQDPALVEEVRQRGVALELCPRSNVQTRAVASLAAHPADRLLRRGLRVTISTDGRTSSATTLTQEFERLRAEFGWGPAEFDACQRHAAEAAFAPAQVRQGLLASVGRPSR
jgi:adenosine deaminase